MRLAAPYALFLLPGIPLLVWYLRQKRQEVTVSYSVVGEVAAIPASPMTRLAQALPWVRGVALGLGVIALAGPQQGLQATKIYREGIAIVMVVDISSSMGALDLAMDGQQSNRLQVVKRTFQRFVQGGKSNLEGREGDFIGMVTFARYADSLCPLTLDHDTLLALLEQVDLVAIPEEDGTAIGEAIVAGVERLKRSMAKSRVLILLTDGENNAGETEPLQAASLAQALGMKIYTIGAGTRGVAPVPVRTRSGQVMLQQMRVSIDEPMLTKIAETTGGRYFRATDGAALEAIYTEIDRLEKTAVVEERFQQYRKRFGLFLLPALGLIVGEIVLRTTRLRQIP